MKTNRVEYSIEHIVGLKGARVLADVKGFHVEILAFTIGPESPAWNNLGANMLLGWALERTKQDIRLKYNVKDAIIPDDYGGPSAS